MNDMQALNDNAEWKLCVYKADEQEEMTLRSAIEDIVIVEFRFEF